MLKEFIETIAAMAPGKLLVTRDGSTYTRFPLTHIDTSERDVVPLEFATLDGLAAFATPVGETSSSWRRLGSPSVFIHIVSETHVSIVGDLIAFNQRHVYGVAEPPKDAGFPFGKMMDQESFVVGLQSCFVRTPEVDTVLAVVGNLVSEAVNVANDDGVTQVVTARRGIAKVANVTVPNPVTLRPYRTFGEIEQPESRYVLRLRRENDSGMPTIGLFEVADNQWRLEAMRRIADYLRGKLGDSRVVLA